MVIPQLKVCAVSLEPTRDAMGVDKASLLATDLSIPQAWGLAVQQHPAAFDALKYSSRFIDQGVTWIRDGIPPRSKRARHGAQGGAGLSRRLPRTARNKRMGGFQNTIRSLRFCDKLSQN